MNFIRKHALELAAQGVERPAARLFSNPAGDFGSMVNERVSVVGCWMLVFGLGWLTWDSSVTSRASCIFLYTKVWVCRRYIATFVTIDPSQPPPLSADRPHDTTDM